MRQILTSSRLPLWVVIWIFAASLSVSQPEPAPNPQPLPTNPDMTAESIKAITRGLDALHSRVGKSGRYGNNYTVASTSLVGLAFLAGGHLPAEGKYGETIRAIIKYILRCQDSKGYISEPETHNSRMHGHGFATWFLAEAYGMSRSLAIDREQIKSALKKSINVIENSQSQYGGWYYEPVKSGDEGSITVCIVQALRAARNAGIAVDQNVIKNGIQYLKQCSNPDGSFRYALHHGQDSASFALTAGGTSSLCLYGEYTAPETIRGLALILRFKPGTSENWGSYPYYSNFYATLAMHLAGEKYWREWFPKLRDHLVKTQAPDGLWPEAESDKDYSTAMACLILQMPHQYLPLFQK